MAQIKKYGWATHDDGSVLSTDELSERVRTGDLWIAGAGEAYSAQVEIRPAEEIADMVAEKLAAGDVYLHSTIHDQVIGGFDAKDQLEAVQRIGTPAPEEAHLIADEVSEVNPLWDVYLEPVPIEEEKASFLSQPPSPVAHDWRIVAAKDDPENSSTTFVVAEIHTADTQVARALAGEAQAGRTDAGVWTNEETKVAAEWVTSDEGSARPYQTMLENLQRSDDVGMERAQAARTFAQAARKSGIGAFFVDRVENDPETLRFHDDLDPDRVVEHVDFFQVYDHFEITTNPQAWEQKVPETLIVRERAHEDYLGTSYAVAVGTVEEAAENLEAARIFSAEPTMEDWEPIAVEDGAGLRAGDWESVRDTLQIQIHQVTPHMSSPQPPDIEMTGIQQPQPQNRNTPGLS